MKDSAPSPILPPIVIDGLHLPAEALSVATMRPLNGGGPEVAREMPTEVELRLDVRGCETLDEAMRARVLSHPALQADRRGVVRVTVATHPSRARNLHEARAQMGRLVSEALRGIDRREPPPVVEVPRPRRGAGLHKRA
jgi:hypothetical protein